MHGAEAEQEEVVILVHGTFASDASDEGDRWWQKGSFFYEALSQRLPDHIRLVEPGEFFRWGGENSNVHRVGAAIDLHALVKGYEARGVPYHIVAHSHGGTAAWIMLFIAQDHLTKAPMALGATQMPQLVYLRSLTTVGAPFIHLRRKSTKTGWRRFLPFGLFLLLLSGCLLAFPGQEIAVFFVVMVILGLFYTLNLVGMMTAFVLDRQVWMQNVPDLIIAPYGPRWLGIWSEDDEALALLRAALKLQETPQTLKAVDADFPKSFFANMRFRLALEPALRVRSLWRRLTMPMLDAALKTRLASMILGVQDVSAVRAVEPWPHDSLARSSALSVQVQQDLKDQCDAALAKSSSGARPALKYLSIGSVEDALKAFGDTNKAMIHNSYFDHPAVIDLIVEKIRGAG